MLLSLKISNIALIEDVEIQFIQGLNILSGETGAGKSIILDSIALISGEHAKTDLIRTGKQEAKILAIFDIENDFFIKNHLDSLGIDTSENLLIIERQIFRDKRASLAFVNHSRILVHVLKDIGQHLLDIHSQHENQDLFDNNKHLDILDHYQGLDKEVKIYRQLFQDAIALKKQVQELEQQKLEQEEKESFYKYQLEELENAELQIQEWEDLEISLHQTTESHQLLEELNTIYTILYEHEQYSLTNQIQEVSFRLQKKLLSEEIQNQTQEYLQEALIKIQEVTEIIRTKKDSLDISPEDIETQQQRYSVLKDLQQKYRKSLPELIEYQQEIAESLSISARIQDQILEIEKQRETLKQQLINKALEISHQRQIGSLKLEEDIKKELKDLHMFNTEFQIQSSIIEDESSNVILPNGKKIRLLKDGLEKIEFFVSFNQGEAKKSLAKVGSGGEIARLMLALKKILHQVSPVSTQIFDEIDTGIGGETAFAVGSKLLEISFDRQVICITHLPQIAAMGELQYLVMKTVENQRTQTTIKVLLEEEREKEISRMLSGETLSPVSLEHAKELLNYKNTRKN